MHFIYSLILGVSHTEDAPLAPDLQLDWLSSTESDHSDDDSGIEVLSVQYNSSNNNNNNISVNSNNNNTSNNNSSTNSNSNSVSKLTIMFNHV